MWRYPLVEKGPGLALALGEPVADAADVFGEQHSPELLEAGWR